MMEQVIRPAGAGHETLWIGVLCAAILATSGTVIALRTHTVSEAVQQTGVLDARHDLNAAEQGLFADLRVAHDEIAAENSPDVAALAEAGLPPFAPDATSVRRGGHAWQRLQRGQDIAYLGTSTDAKLAGSMLLRLAGESHAAHGHAQEAREPEIWLSRSASLAPPASLEPAALTTAGWRKVAARFDAGVTRQKTHP